LNRFSAILKTLADHGVDFIVVGGAAAVALGAPITTWDLDVVHSREDENLKRLKAALDALDARYKFRPEHRPNESHLESKDHQLLSTRLGRLDVLGAIGNGLGYPDLLPHSELVEVADGLRVPVLDLETQIAIKETTGREKDIAVLPTLRRTLIESRRLKQG
jgi:predicted nucleotidyltransferase